MLRCALLASGSVIRSAGVPTAWLYTLFLIAAVVAGAGMFALRGLCFAIMRDGRTPLRVNGILLQRVASVVPVDM